MVMTLRTLARMLSAALLVLALSTGFAYAQNGNGQGGNGNGQGGNGQGGGRWGVPGPIAGADLETLLLVAGAGGIYWVMRRNRRKTSSASR